MLALRFWPVLCATVGCSGVESVVRSDEPLPNAWLQVSILATGPASTFYKYDRCRKLAREHGIWVHTDAGLKVVFTLELNHNRVTVGRNGTAAQLDRVLPEWRMESLCSAGLAMAAEFSGRKVKVSKTAPPEGCVDRGIIQGESTGVAAEAAVEDIKLRAARYGINYVVQDAAPTRSSVGLYLGGRGFVCPHDEDE